jgi:hypothetical protein
VTTAAVATSSDERFLVRLLAAMAAERLEAIVVGAAGAVLHGVPIMTQDVDLLVRDTTRNRAKLAALARRLGATGPSPLSDLTAAVRLGGLEVAVDFLFDEIAGGLSFAAVRSRAIRRAVGPQRAIVASLEDIVRSKEAADRPKDRAQLPLLRATLKLRDSAR